MSDNEDIVQEPPVKEKNQKLKYKLEQQKEC